MLDFVRRRHWIRRARKDTTPSAASSSATIQRSGSDASDSARTVAPEGGEQQNLRRMLGIVQPGGTLALPQDWHSTGQQLQVGFNTYTIGILIGYT